MKICANGCDRTYYARGLCGACYQRASAGRIAFPPYQKPVRLAAAGEPRCEYTDCFRPVKARGKCRAHYEQWLSSANPAEKVRRAAYPSDEKLIRLFAEQRSVTAVAKILNVSRGSLRDYLERRPELNTACREFVGEKLPPEVVAQRNKDAGRTWRRNNRDKVRASKRRWAAGRSAEDVRRWNVHNAARRRAQSRRDATSVEETRLQAEYERILRGDPCVFLCGRPATTSDHIRPINTGGVDAWTNLAASCGSCNSSKRDKELLHFLLWRLDHGIATPQFISAFGGGDALPVGAVYA